MKKMAENKERFATYIGSLADILPPYLEELESYATGVLGMQRCRPEQLVELDLIP